MKKILIFLLVLVAFACEKKTEPGQINALLSAPAVSDVILKTSDWNIDAVKYGIKAGSRVILQGPSRAEIEFHNLTGTEQAPIVITALEELAIKGVNPGGRVVTFYNCKNVRLTGDPTGNGDMNISISNGGQGVDFRDLSKGVEADHLNIDVGYSGLNAKTDPTCDPKTWRITATNPGGFVLDGVKFHHNYIKTKTGEGIYIGESHYHSTFPLTGCASGVKTAQEHEVKNADVQYNVIVTSGADGIQVGSCPTGAIIANNNVSLTGTAKVYGQTAGIICNPGTVGIVYNNVVEGTYGFGLQLQGPGGSDVHNNVFINCGSTNDGGAIMQVNYIPNGKVDAIYNNTIIGAKRTAIEYYNTVNFKNNIVNVVSGATTYKLGTGSAIITKVNNYDLVGDPAQLKLDSKYTPTVGSPVYSLKEGEDIGAVQSVKQPPIVITNTPGVVNVRDSAGVRKVYVTYGSKEIRIK